MTDANDYTTPIVLGDSLPSGEQFNRLTKLEYFAAMAMQGYLASYPPESLPSKFAVSSHAVSYAKALIEELNKQ